jgi:putative flippase GtrA
VRLSQIIPEHRRSLVKELVTFGTVGGINTALGQVLFNVFFFTGFLTANTISTGIATFCSFILNRHVTYRHRARTSLRRELPLFIFLNLIGLGIQLAILDGGRRLFHIDSADRFGLNVVRFGGVAVGTVFLLLTYRTFVFKKEPEEAHAALVSVVPAVPAQGSTGPHGEFELLTDPLEDELAAIDEPDPNTDRPAPANGLR